MTARSDARKSSLFLVNGFASHQHRMKPEKAQEAIAFFEELLKEGIITEKDYQDKKNDILNLVEKTISKETTNDTETVVQTRVLMRSKKESFLQNVKRH